MKRLLMMLFFVSCISFVANAVNGKPTTNEKKMQKKTQQQSKVKLSQMKITESIVPVDDDDDGSGDGEGGKGKAKKNGKCQNGSGKCTAS